MSENPYPTETLSGDADCGTMSADLLREAANLMRSEWSFGGEYDQEAQRDCAAWNAVADWLDETAAYFTHDVEREMPEALAVARAYLGREA